MKTWEEFKNRLCELDSEAEQKIGEGIVPAMDIVEIAFKEFQLDAYKAGMTKAANIAVLHDEPGVTACSERIEQVRDNLKPEDMV